MKTTIKSTLTGYGLAFSYMTGVFAMTVCIGFSPLLSGCGTVSKIYKAATAEVNMSASGETGVVHDDKIVVNAEKALYIGLDTFNLFLDLEFNNRALFDKIPGAHATAERIRRDGKNWIESLQRAKNAYKNNRSNLNHANLSTALKTVQAAIAESKFYIAKKG